MNGFQDGIQTEEEARAKAEKLPEWVKCMYCGGRPKLDDYLGEVVPNSSALAHQSCMASRGQIFGLNAGILPDLKAKPTLIGDADEHS